MFQVSNAAVVSRSIRKTKAARIRVSFDIDEEYFDSERERVRTGMFGGSLSNTLGSRSGLRVSVWLLSHFMTCWKRRR
jgi:hypothetical protein